MNVKTLLMGASALVVASVAAAGGAQAQTQINGGGSTLIAPYLRQAADCYGNPTVLYNQGVAPYDASSAATTPTTTTVAPFDFMGSPNFNCASQHVDTSVQINYIGSGSGNGQAGVFTHDTTTFVGNVSPGTPLFTSIQYGAGDYGIGGADVAAYNNGGVTTLKTPAYKDANGVSQGGLVVNLLASDGSGSVSGDANYPNPRAQYGAFIQVPISVDPVAIAYAPVYKEVANAAGAVTSYKFKIKTPNKDTSGGLRLDMATVCGIFNGVITNWNDPAIQALNGGLSLKDPADTATFSVPIEMVGRADGSGTTSIFYRALAAQCSGTTYSGTNNYAATGGKTLPTALTTGGATYVSTNPNSPGLPVVTGKFNLATGSGGVAKYIAFTATPAAGQTLVQGRIAYLGTDYVLPAVLSTNANTYGLNVANLLPGVAQAGNTTYLEPVAKNAIKAFGAGPTAILPPQSNSGGTYENGTAGHIPPASSHGSRSAPQDWAEPLTTTVTYSTGETTATPLADPNTYLSLTGAKVAYPIVGTTNLFLNTCYSNAAVTTGLINFAKFYFNTKTAPKVITDATNGVLAKAGLSALPTAWEAASLATFFVPTVSGKTNTLGTDSLNLAIETVGYAGVANGTRTFEAQCKTVTPGA